MPDFITVKEASELLRVTDRTLYDLCRQGKVPGAAKVGGQWRLDRERLLAWLAQGGEAAADRATDNNEND
jgi:excisionase family DNA binding protein